MRPVGSTNLPLQPARWPPPRSPPPTRSTRPSSRPLRFATRGPRGCSAALALDGPKAQRAADDARPATRSAICSLHLPRDRREARAVAELVPGDSATVVVQVRSISSRSVRRRGMRPLVEATVADETGVMKATFFNQPWLEQRYPAGTRLALHGKFEGRRRFRVQAHARTGDAVSGSGAVAHYPATDGLSSTQILALVREHQDALRDFVEPLPARLRARERLPERTAALTEAHFGGAESASEVGTAPAGLRRVAARTAGAPAPAPAAARLEPGAGARSRARADRASGSRRCCPSS